MNDKHSKTPKYYITLISLSSSQILDKALKLERHWCEKILCNREKKKAKTN